MTQDRKADSKGSKEIEKSRKKSDSSASESKEKTALSSDGLPTKVRCDYRAVRSKSRPGPFTRISSLVGLRFLGLGLGLRLGLIAGLRC